MYLIFVGCLVVFGWEFNIYLKGSFIDLLCHIGCVCNVLGWKCLSKQGIGAFVSKF